MGDNSGRSLEQPAHQVTLTKDFYIGVYEVTQEQYELVTGTNHSYFNSPQNPVEVEEEIWEEAVAFCEKLSALPAEKAAGRVYRLPTEAEWEYACRAGTTTAYSFGDDESQMGDFAWYDGNANSTTHPVGQKKPNPWGLYDMYGNVSEWCSDWYSAPYSSEPVSDPQGATTGSFHVYRGGGWFNVAEDCRSAHRDDYDPSFRFYILGFRVALSPPSVESPEADK